MFRVRLHCEHPRMQDLSAAVRDQMEKLRLEQKVKPGQTVAVTAGSRSIAEFVLIVKSAVHHLKGMDAIPFIVPAMGSHGGGTAKGQLAMLKALGITPDAIGCDIRSSMNTLYLGTTKEGFAVHFDEEAYRADHVIVCNRIRPHSWFTGAFESGLMKMMTVGMGNYIGARTYHRAFGKHGFDHVIRSTGRKILSKCPITAGLAIVENGHGDVAMIEAVPPHHFEEREEQLLIMAKKLLPRLPFSEVDLLIVDEMGKNISGTGMDRNVIGPRPFLGSRTSVRKIFGALSRSGKAYWDYVLRTASCEEHRLIKHREFFDTFVRSCFTLGVRYFRLGCRLLGRDKRFSAQQPDEVFRFAQFNGHPLIGQIFVLSLTKETLGNASGLGRWTFARPGF